MIQCLTKQIGFVFSVVTFKKLRRICRNAGGIELFSLVRSKIDVIQTEPKRRKCAFAASRSKSLDRQVANWQETGHA